MKKVQFYKWPKQRNLITFYRIQGEHRLGKANVAQCKPRPIIVCFLLFRKRMNFLHRKET